MQIRNRELSETASTLYPNTTDHIGRRQRAYRILESAREGDVVSRNVDLILIFLITTSVVAVILESIPAVELAYSDVFYWTEVITVAVFTVEYFLRIWCAADDEKHAGSGMRPLEIRIRFLFSPYAIIDFLAILPFYLLMGGIFGNVDWRFLRSIRLLRILKLTRYSSAFDMLATTCRENTRPLIAAFFILVTVMLMAASGMYFFERHAQPVAFASIPDAMWWAVSTLTTVGYGDVTPITAGGKIFGAIITVIGIGMVALPTGILASGYSMQSSLRSDRYRQEASQVLDDGVISGDESFELEKLRIDLSLGKHTATQILDQERVSHALASTSGDKVCPHCGATRSSG